jgi:hypothetical protein
MENDRQADSATGAPEKHLRMAGDIRKPTILKTRQA